MTRPDFWIAQWVGGELSVHPTKGHAEAFAKAEDFVIGGLRPYVYGEQIDD